MIHPTDICHECQEPRFHHTLLHGRLACPSGGTTFYIPQASAAGEEKPGGMNAWDKTIGDILDWQRKQFPDATERSSLKHLKKEILEVEQNLEAGEETIGEWADVFFMLLQAADRNPQGKNLLTALRAKLDINRFEREWKPADAEGVFHHKTPEGLCDHETIPSACPICNSTKTLPLPGE
jgi:hypothetical protein